MILPDSEQFTYKPCVISGDDCWLITPNHIGVKWSKDNERFRSIIIRQSDNHIISHGFSKFKNYFEDPDFQKWDESWNFEARHKYDGSCLIISKHKGQLIHRTRGTLCATQMPNGHEIDFLIKKYPLVFDNEHINKENITILTEWCTPSNTIVLREFKEPTLVLLNIVNNATGEYESQSYLDYLGKLWCIHRPEHYKYNSVSECIADVKAWRGKEGVVLYSPDYQTLKKIKGDEYLAAHRICTGIKNLSHILELFLASPRFTKSEEFFKYVETMVNYELAIKIEDDIEKIAEAYAEFLQTLELIKNYLKSNVLFLETRKEQARQIQIKYKEWQLPIAFTLLDNREVDDKLVKKSMEKILGIC
jgi:hypothetical protein